MAGAFGGNTIVIKPSLTPINCQIFAKIVHSSGLPAGAFNAA